MKNIWVLLLCFGLCGCMPVLYKPGITQAEADKDTYECSQQACAAVGDNWLFGRGLYKQCLTVRGYTAKR